MGPEENPDTSVLEEAWEEGRQKALLSELLGTLFTVVFSEKAGM